MTGIEAAIAALRLAYPRADWPEESQRFYVRQLADLDGMDLVAAVRRIVNREKFLPTVAEIRQEVAEARLGLPSPAEAWAIAERGALKDAPEEVRLAAESVGGRWSILHSDRPEITRSQFVRDYEQRRDKALRVEMQAEPVGMWAIHTPQPPALDLPESERIMPRPVLLRAMARRSGRDLDPPSEAERLDCVRVLADGYSNDLLYEEAERIFCEASE